MIGLVLNRFYVSLLLVVSLFAVVPCGAVMINVPDEINSDTTATMQYTEKVGLDFATTQERMAREQEEQRLALQRAVLETELAKIHKNYETMKQKPGLFSVRSLRREQGEGSGGAMSGLLLLGGLFLITLCAILLWLRVRPKMREAEAASEAEAKMEASFLLGDALDATTETKPRDAEANAPARKKQIETRYSGISLGGGARSGGSNGNGSNPKKKK